MLLAVMLLLPLGDGFEEIGRPFLERHCVSCHDPGAAEGASLAGGLDLASVTAVEGAALDWDWLLERVEFEEMPPPGEADPAAEERAAFVEWLRGEIGGTEPGGEPLPLAPVELRRLTAAEYAAAVRDLFGVDFDASRVLPEDAIGHGFDHVGAAQSLSEAHFVQYLRAAEIVAERAIPTDDGSEPRVVRVEAGDLRGGRTAGSAHWIATRGSIQAPVPIPRAGRYVVRARVFGAQAGPDPCRCTLQLAGVGTGDVFDVPATAEAPMTIEAELEVERGGDLRAEVRFLNDYYDATAEDPAQRDRNMAAVWIEVEGPIGPARPTPFLEGLLARVESARSPERGLREAVGELAALVWRVPEVEDVDVRRLLGLSGWRDDVAVRLRMALVGVLASPRFVFKEETGVFEQERGPRRAASSGPAPDARGSVALGGCEVATRLAGFLWRSVPDSALLERARAGDLDQETGLVDVVRSMLADPRADAFILSFGEQWLQLRGLDERRADRAAFPEFSGAIRLSMLEETRRVLVDSLRERRSLWDLVDGTETFVDRRLAAHYDVEANLDRDLDGDGKGDGDGDWARVSVAETERRGLLGHGSVLFLTSEATRTSPVKRGKWVLEVLLGSAPPPPPPGAGNLPPEDESTAALSFRERFEAHRADPNCAACHARMDPLGFGLEAFDAVGRARPADDPARRELAGVLPDGRAFDGPVELYGVLRGEERFLEALVERVWIFALGRGVHRADRASLAGVLAALDPRTPTFEDVVLGIVRTPEFRRIAATR